MNPNVYSSTCNKSQIWKEPKCPSTGEWIKKLLFIYTMEYYLAMRKNEIWPFVAKQMEMEGIMLSERSQAEKDRHHVFHSYVDPEKLNKRP